MDNPWSVFPNHLIVEYQNSLYDPSYGSDLAANKNIWQANNITYFGTLVRAREKGVPRGQYRRYYWLRPVNNETIPDLEDVTYPYN